MKNLMALAAVVVLALSPMHQAAAKDSFSPSAALNASKTGSCADADAKTKQSTERIKRMKQRLRRMKGR